MSRNGENLWIREGADRGKWRDAEWARVNRREIQQALSSGEVSRPDLVKWGLFTGAGMLAPIGGLSPFGGAYAQTTASSSGQNGSGVPTGLPACPTFGVAPFNSPLYRFDILPQHYVTGSAAAQHPVPSIPQSATALSPTPAAQANQTQQTLDPALVGGKTGPIEGRPPGSLMAHQQFSQFPPRVQLDIITGDATANTSCHPGVPSNFNNGINPVGADRGDLPGTRRSPGRCLLALQQHLEWWRDRSVSCRRPRFSPSLPLGEVERARVSGFGRCGAFSNSEPTGIEFKKVTAINPR